MNLMKFKHAFSVFLFLVSGTVASARIKHPATGEVPHASPEVALKFIENKGQWTPEAKYMTGVPGGNMFITDKGFVYNYENMNDEETYHHAAEAGKDVSNMTFHYHSYRMNFIGANKDIKYAASQKSANYNNYFIGNDKSKWVSKVGLYGVVNQSNIYNGIDATIYSKGLSLKYDFTVAPGADVNLIKMSFEGVTPEITKEGNLRIVTSVNEVIEQAPYTYQLINGKQKEIHSRYKLSKGVLSYELLEDYDHTKALIIDPVLVFATYSGATGSGAYYAYSTTYDALGNTYAAGLTSGTAWPTTLGAYSTTLPGANSVCINKYNAAGNLLIYSTYFGGNNTTQPNALRCNSLNELVMIGATFASNLGTTTGAYDNSLNGGSDLYVVRFSVDGSTLVGCTYLGGANTEAACLDIIGNTTPTTQTSLTSSGVTSPCDLIFDNQDNIWVVSNTNSTDFPVTANAFQSTNAGSYDGVVCKLSANCTALQYSSYYGGSANDILYSINFLANGNPVVVGGTQSTDITTTPGTLHTTSQGNWDGYAAVINPNQNTLLAATYLGTAGNDNATKLQVDGNDNIYVLGRTMGAYPISTGVYSIANGDVFIDKLNTTLTTSLMSTRTGNPEDPTSTSSITRYLPTAFLLDICENIYVAGLTPSHAAPGLPTTPDAFSTVSKPFWFCVLEPQFSGLLFASFFGIGTGDHPHCGTSRLDPTGIVYHSFCSATNISSDPNVHGTVGSWSYNKQNTSNDIYTYKFNFEATGVNSDFELDPAVSGNDTGCAPYQVHFINTSVSAEVFTWDFGDGSPTSALAEPIHVYNTPGVYTVSLHANNDSSCITDDTAFITITVLQVNPPDFDVHDTLLCTFEQSIHVGATLNNASQYTTVQWGPLTGILGVNNTPDITVDPSVNNVYNITVKDTIPGICGFSATKTVHIDLAPRVLDIINSDTVVCEGTVIPISAVGTPGYTYVWSPATGVSNSTALTPNITVNQPNFYTLTGSYSNCPDTSVTINIGMQFNPHLTISEDKFVCQGTDVTLESNVTPFRNDYTYNWTPATANLTTPTGPNTHFIADSNIVYYLSVKTPIGCSDADTVAITVYPLGFGSIVSDTGYCSGINGSVNLWANGGATYQWSPAYGLSNTNIANPVANPSTTTNYTVLIKDAHNCLDTEKVTVQVYPSAEINIPDSVNIYPGENYQIEPGTNCLYFTWFPASGLDDAHISDPHMSPQVRTRYFVTATTEHGCTIHDSVDVLVKETSLDMPNAFKPGNGSNALFKPSKRGIAKLNSFTVYNRWGNKVYSSTNIDAGWDGTYNDVPQPLGVYMYVIDAVSDNGKAFIKQGNVTLMR